MNMTHDPKLVQALFLAALEIPEGADRQDWLDDQCAHDAQLKQRVVALLEAHAATYGFGAQASAPAIPMTADATVQSGTMLAGRYKLLEPIGEGGMGTVWLAEQIEPVRRKVAVKLVKAGMDSKQVLARFEAERQALALMDHPNIAKVLDGGLTAEGRPFFVMEYVKGIPLTEYCDKHQSTLAERLELIVPVCQAIQHAHQKGILHRDLKPSNVLVCLYDGHPIPRVIDFGLAKAMHQSLTDRTLFTGHGLVLGTPLYMSPEQAELNNLDVDTRSDVYSLGVLLYELLTGSTPLESAKLKEAALTEILRLIKDTDPPKPSTRVSTSMQLPSIAAQRKIDPRQLSRAISGDLDWIVMKALEKDRSRRYETANALARDIQRFLASEPVEACPPSTAYRLKKYYSRNRPAILTAVGFAILLVTSAVLTSWQAIRATRSEGFARDAQRAEADQRRQAEQQRDEAEKLKEDAVVRSHELQKLTEAQRRSLYASDMNLVRLEADRGNFVRMRELLYNQLPIHGDQDLRGIEWSYWYNFLNASKSDQRVSSYPEPDVDKRPSITLLTSPNSLATSTSAIFPGAELAAFSLGNETRIVRIDSKEEIQRIPVGMTILVNRTRFTANGCSIFAQTNTTAAFGSPTARVSDNVAAPISVYQPGKQPILLAYPENSFAHISQIAASRDGKFVGVIGNAVDHQPTAPSIRILIWDIQSQQIIFNQPVKREFNRLELNHDGSGVAIYVAHGSLRNVDRPRVVASVWNVRLAKEVQTIQYDDDIDTVAWHPSKPTLYLTTLGFSGNNTKQLLRWSVVDNKLERLSSEMMPNFVRVEPSPNGQELAIYSHGSDSIRLVDSTSGNVVRKLFHPEAQVESVSFSADGRELVASTLQGHVLRWDLDPGSDLFGLRKSAVLRGSSIRYWTFDRAFNQVAFVSNNSILVRHRSGHAFTIQPANVEGSIQTPLLRFSPDGKYLAACLPEITKRAQLVFIDCQSGQIAWQQELPYDQNTYYNSVAFSPDQKEILVSDRGQLTRIEISSGKRQEISKEKCAYGYLETDISSQRLLVGVQTDFPKTAFQIRDAVQGQVLHEMPLEFGKNNDWQLSSLYPAPDGKHLVALLPYQLMIWNLESRAQVYQTDGLFLASGGQAFPQIEFSPDGHYVAVPVSDLGVRRVTSNSVFARIKQVDVIDLRTPGKVSRVALQGDYADDYMLSPDGKRLLTFHGKNPLGGLEVVAKAKLWDLQSTRELLTLPLEGFSKSTWDMFFDPEQSALVALSFNLPFGSRGHGNSIVFDARPLEGAADNALIAQQLVQHLVNRGLLPNEIQSAIATQSHANEQIKILATQLASELSIDPDTIAKDIMADLAVPGLSQERLRHLLRNSQALYEREPSSPRALAILATVKYLNGDVSDALRLATAIHSEIDDDSDYALLGRMVEATCSEESSDPLVQHKRLIAIANSIDRRRAKGIKQLPSLQLALVLFKPESGELQKELMKDKPQVRTKVVSKTASSTPALPDPWQNVKVAMSKMDKNADGQVSLDELDVPGLDRSKLDRDNNQLLDLHEAITAIHVTSILQKAKVAPSKMAEFDKKDIDHDGRLTVRDKVDPRMIESMDTDKDGEISQGEYHSMLLRNATLTLVLSRQLAKLPDEAQLSTLEYFLNIYPDETNMLNGQAWLLATCPNDKLRDGQRALTAALKAVAGKGASIPGRLDTLAAAYAETGDFKRAEATQRKVLEMTNSVEEYRQRLELYTAGKPFRRLPTDEATSTSTTEDEKPRWSQHDLNSFRKIVGGEPCWTPDGQKLLYVLTVFGAEHSYFETIDLKTGQQQILGRGGRNPRFSAQNDSWLAFDTSRETKTSANDRDSKVWLQRLGSDQYQQIGMGECLGWDNQGKLYIMRGNQLLKVDPKQPDAAETLLEANLANCAISPDGAKMAYSKFGKWTICNLSAPTDNLDGYNSQNDLGSVDWSPDGQRLLFGSSDPNRPGLWLIDATTGKRTLLAEIICKPRWSPDGKQVALGLLNLNLILIFNAEQLPR